MTKKFNLENLVAEVFGPRPGDVFAILADRPETASGDNPAWQERRDMAADWRDQIAAMGERHGFNALPLVSFPAVADANAEFPAYASVAGEKKPFTEVLDQATVVISMTEVSITGPLMAFANTKGSAEKFRVASMPLANRSMEDTCLMADTRFLVKRGNVILDAMKDAQAAEVRFTTGDTCMFDLRFRQAYVDNGYLHPDKEGDAFINLPSGEVWIVPYEGERPGEKSRTRGIIPVAGGHNEIARFVVEENRITDVMGEGAHADALREELDIDPARRNVGEIAFGYNYAARVTGLFIEDEKAGFHWGYGRSEFLGGTVGPEAFRTPDTVLHRDLPYAKECPVTVSVDLVKTGGERLPVLRDGDYVLR
ncbi:MAG: aminopeptidase [Gammaproteobacteria bacterium]|nr:aminopeptidase [Gammaproteobacteria bacterium]MDE0514514.1 aminopeptidase [Gammaproteobacteria bacterium]